MSAPHAYQQSAAPPSEILVVAPSEQGRDSIVTLLSTHGHEVESCEDPDQAVGRLEEREFPVVVLSAAEGEAGSVGCLLNWIGVRHPSTGVVVLSPPEAGQRAIGFANSGAIALVHTPVVEAELVRATARAARSHQVRELARRRQEDLYVRRRHLDALSRVFENGVQQMNLVYQPIIRASTGCVLAYEALLRTSTMRLRGARPLVHLADRLGRQAELDDRVRTLVSRLFEETTQHRTIFVNLDLGELTRGLIGTSEDPLRPYANRVVLEFDSDAPLPELPAVGETLRRARDCGYRFAAGSIAGTVGGLSRLRLLEPEVYKLGAAVVQGSDLDELKRAHIARLVELAHAEGALVVAQGIERPEEREVAAGLGCDLLQGYLLGLPREEFE